jgi:hypothetical protein
LNSSHLQDSSSFSILEAGSNGGDEREKECYSVLGSPILSHTIVGAFRSLWLMVGAGGGAVDIRMLEE